MRRKKIWQIRRRRFKYTWKGAERHTVRDIRVMREKDGRSGRDELGDKNGGENKQPQCKTQYNKIQLEIRQRGSFDLLLDQAAITIANCSPAPDRRVLT